MRKRQLGMTSILGPCEYNSFVAILNFCDKNSVSLFRNTDAFINCKIVATPEKLNPKPATYGFQKDSPYLPLFNYVLNTMRERGSLKQIKVKYEPPPQICPDYSGKSLGVNSVFSAFGVLFSGVGIALILFGLEKLTQSFGMKWSIFNSYGVVDRPAEFYENDKMALLESKNYEIVLLKQEILMLKKCIFTNK